MIFGTIESWKISHVSKLNGIIDLYDKSYNGRVLCYFFWGAPHRIDNLFSLLDPAQFSQCITAHLKYLHPDLAEQLIAVDGKTIRGSGKNNLEQQHCLSAYAAEAGLTLDVFKVERKELTEAERSNHVYGVDFKGWFKTPPRLFLAFTSPCRLRTSPTVLTTGGFSTLGLISRTLCNFLGPHVG